MTEQSAARNVQAFRRTNENYWICITNNNGSTSLDVTQVYILYIMLFLFVTAIQIEPCMKQHFYTKY